MTVCNLRGLRLSVWSKVSTWRWELVSTGSEPPLTSAASCEDHRYLPVLVNVHRSFCTSSVRQKLLRMNEQLTQPHGLSLVLRCNSGLVKPSAC